MPDQPHAHDEPRELIRTRDFDTDEPIHLDISNELGSVRIELTDTQVAHVQIRQEHATADPNDWRNSLSGLLNWVGGQVGDPDLRERVTDELNAFREPLTDAVHNTRIDFTGNRLTVRTPSPGPMRTTPLAITVVAPRASHVNASTRSGGVTVTGEAERIRIESGTGAISVDQATDAVHLRTGSGQLRLGELAGRVRARAGSGSVEIAGINAPSSITTSSGDVWIGTLSDNVTIRCGSGDITIAEAAAGQAELVTGSGEIHTSLRGGVCAEIDLVSSTGRLSSDLPVSDRRPDTEPTLHLSGRTGSGDVTLGQAG